MQILESIFPSSVEQELQLALEDGGGISTSTIISPSFTGWRILSVTGNESKLFNVSLDGDTLILTPKFQGNKSFEECTAPTLDGKVTCKQVMYFQPDSIKMTQGNRTESSLEKNQTSDTFIYRLDVKDGLLYKFGRESVIIVGDTSYNSKNINITQEIGFAHANITSVAPYNSLVGYYPFEPNTSSTTTFDFSNTGNDGTLEGNIMWETRTSYGGDYLLSGPLADRINLGSDDSLNFTNKNMTWCLWLTPRQLSFGNQWIMNRWDLGGSGTGPIIFVTTAGDDIQWMIGTTGSGSIQTTGNILSVDEPVHICTSAAGTGATANLTIYVDGVPDVSAIRTRVDGSTDDFYIGGDLLTFTTQNGSYDEVMLFNTSLTAPQVLDIFNNQSVRYAATGQMSFPPTVTNNKNDNRLNVSLSGIEHNISTNVSARFQYWNVTDGYNLSDPNLVAHYTFDLGFNDSTGLHNGTPTSNPVIDGVGIYSDSVLLDGIADSIVIDSVVESLIVDTATMSAWVKHADGTSSSEQVIGDPFDNFNIDFRSSERYQCEVDTQSSLPVNVTSNVAITDTDYHHIVCRYDGAEVSLWVDGAKQDDVAAISGDLSLASVDFAIGAVSFGVGEYDGNIEDVIIYNRSLSDDEVRDLFFLGITIGRRTTDSVNITAANIPFTLDATGGVNTYFLELLYNTNPNNFYSPLVIGNITLDSFPSVNTCTPPGSGNWDISCPDNCIFNENQIVPGNISITSADGNVTLNANLTFVNAGSHVSIAGSQCKVVINPGGGFV